MRQVEFTFTRKDTDSDTDTTATLKVPLLTIVPIPYLRIDDMTIDFTSKITEEMIRKTQRDRTTEAEASLKPSRPVRLLTRLARTTNEDSKTTFDVKMRVKIAQSDFPLGIERLLNTADLSVEDRSDAE